MPGPLRRTTIFVIAFGGPVSGGLKRARQIGIRKALVILPGTLGWDDGRATLVSHRKAAVALVFLR